MLDGTTRIPRGSWPGGDDDPDHPVDRLSRPGVLIAVVVALVVVVLAALLETAIGPTQAVGLVVVQGVVVGLSPWSGRDVLDDALLVGMATSVLVTVAATVLGATLPWTATGFENTFASVVTLLAGLVVAPIPGLLCVLVATAVAGARRRVVTGYRQNTRQDGG